MNFGRRTDESAAARIIDRAIERGTIFFDTANAYADGDGERMLARLLQGRRGRVLISSKVGLGRVGGAPSGLIAAGGKSEGLSQACILAACDESLARLSTDVIDVYYLHVPDRDTPIEESLSAIQTLLQQGKIRAWATSNYASWQMLEMLNFCDREGLPRPLLTQQLYNLLIRQLDLEYFAFAKKYALHTSVYNPLAGGLLTGKHHSMGTPSGRFLKNPMYQGRYWSKVAFAQVGDYLELAGAAGLDPVTLAYAWLATRPGVDSIVIGPASVEHLDAALDGACVTLDDGMRQRLDQLHQEHRGTDARYARL
jgi:aryl-alcohol dehydrogenase-like predicted oxidoreductase